MFDKTDQLAVETIRTLSIDAVEKAQSGHPGLPMGAAPMAYILWSRHLQVNPQNSSWFDRDRFILSAGHGSALLYSLLHLSGYDVSLDDLKNFRQLDSKTPGHPEVYHTDGVETTTGPLGQGFANGVGMAMAEAHLRATYNETDFPVVDHHTYVLASDGDLQEGISHEAASLAGHLQLGKLIVLYDSNDVQLDGDTQKAFSEDVGARFKAYGWDYQFVSNGTDLDVIDQTIEQAKNSNKPSLIEIKTVIGHGAPEAGSSAVHGAPLGEEGVQAAKQAYKWQHSEPFYVPDEVYARFNDTIAATGKKAENQWNELLDEYQHIFPKKAKAFAEVLAGCLPKNWSENLPQYAATDEAKATRAISGEIINSVAKYLPNFWGGSADLSGSNKTQIENAEDFSAANYAGKNIWYGVREHAMASALNGILLHGGTQSFVSTFFVFTDYLRPAVRLAALSQIPAIYVMTHDSIAVGEDGPTHEPIEQLASFRAMQNVNVIRPADGNETVGAWEVALQAKSQPTMLVLTRQKLPNLPVAAKDARYGVSKGAYVISPQQKEIPEGILIATGSEVSLAIEAQKQLSDEGKDVSVISMPSMDLFEQQTQEYQESVLPTQVRKRLAIEMGSSFGWERYVGLMGDIFSIDRFGASGPGNEVVERYGFTANQVVQRYKLL